MLCGAGFSWTNMVAAQGWLMGGGERLVQAPFPSKSQSSPGRDVCTGDVLDVTLFPKEAAVPS